MEIRKDKKKHSIFKIFTKISFVVSDVVSKWHIKSISNFEDGVPGLKYVKFLLKFCSLKVDGYAIF